MNALRDRVAIITGASRGIGEGIAHRLAREGVRTVLAARSREPLEVCARACREAGAESLAVQADVSSESQVQDLVTAAVRKFGQIDILVNNAGVGFFGGVSEMPISEFDEMWSINVRGTFLMTRAVLPHMVKARGGFIVTIGSLAGKNTFRGGAGYCATKWALRGFMGSLMLEVREHNIRCLTVFPGSVDTQFSARGLKGEHIPKPADVAEAVIFALSAHDRAMFSEIDLRPTNPK